MDPTADVINGKKGQIICRPSTWMDVVLFFAFNYGLHAFTALSAPGSPLINVFSTVLLSLLLPFSGIVKALEIIYRQWRQGASGDLHIAHRAGALCMVIRRRQEQIRYHLGYAKNIYYSRFFVSPSTSVHGQYPYTNNSTIPGNGNKSSPPTIYRLLRVPQSFTVNPPKNSGRMPFRLTYNYSILKRVAGMIQILSGSFGLNRVSQRQLPEFRYASYSLTVVPYILMSLINLVATLCEPQYPSMFLVMYRGLDPPPPVDDILPIPPVRPQSWDDIAILKSELSAGLATASDPLEAQVIGAVGEAFGDLTQLDAQPEPLRDIKSRFLFICVVLVVLCCIAAPYIVLLLLTGFRDGQRTRRQRAWLLAWLAIGQVYGMGYFGSKANDITSINSIFAKSALLCAIMMTGTAAIGGFVVV